MVLLLQEGRCRYAGLWEDSDALDYCRWRTSIRLCPGPIGFVFACDSRHGVCLVLAVSVVCSCFSGVGFPVVFVYSHHGAQTFTPYGGFLLLMMPFFVPWKRLEQHAMAALLHTSLLCRPLLLLTPHWLKLLSPA